MYKTFNTCSGKEVWGTVHVIKNIWTTTQLSYSLIWAVQHWNISFGLLNTVCGITTSKQTPLALRRHCACTKQLGKKMDDTSVCTPLLAESDAQNNTASPPNAASVTDADKVINTKTDSTQVEGEFCREHANSAVRRPTCRANVSFLANWLASSTIEWAS